MYVAEVGSWSSSDPPPFARLAGHPVRWRLLGGAGAQLQAGAGAGDRWWTSPRTWSLTTWAGSGPPGWWEHGAARSTAGDAYYHLDLVNCADALAAAGQALHPGLRLAPAPAAAPVRRCRVLFLCTGNSARSPVAEALLRQRADQIEAVSAGSRPKPLHPNTVRLLREYGIELAAGCRGS